MHWFWLVVWKTLLGNSYQPRLRTIVLIEKVEGMDALKMPVLFTLPEEEKSPELFCNQAVSAVPEANYLRDSVTQVNYKFAYS